MLFSKKMKAIEFLYLVMLLLSAILIYFAIKQYSKTQELLESGIKTKATVIDLIRVSSDDGYTYKPVFEYTDRLQNVISFESEVSANPSPYSIGDKIDIIYSRDNTEKKVVSFWGLYRWTVILLSLASPLLIISGSYLLYTRA